MYAELKRIQQATNLRMNLNGNLTKLLAERERVLAVLCGDIQDIRRPVRRRDGKTVITSDGTQRKYVSHRENRPA